MKSLWLLFWLVPAGLWGQMQIPFLENPPQIDGDLQEWQTLAFHDGLWDLHRVSQTPWYNPRRNRLADHGESGSLRDDLQARYYLGWDSTYFYFGAEVWDNINDTDDPKHAPKRWYYKDAIAFFIEAPRDRLPETFGSGDHSFAFIADTTYPTYGAWWRRGTLDTNYLETPLPAEAVDYRITMNPWSRSEADYILEARVRMEATFGQGDTRWTPPSIGDRYSLMIVHCDPDGGAYGGHLLLYGRGDRDQDWAEIQLAGPKPVILRRDH